MDINEIAHTVQSIPPADRFTDDAIIAFASHPGDDGEPEALFSLLVRVAEVYTRGLRDHAGYEPAAAASCMLAGLGENLADEFDLSLPIGV